MNIPAGEHIPAIFSLCIVDFGPGVVLLQKEAQCRDLHGLTIFDEAIFRQRTHINKEAFLPAAVAAAIKNDAGDKTGAFRLILKFARNVAGKVLSPAGVRVVFVHIGPQVSVQRALRFLIGRLIEVAGVRFAQQHNLKCIDHR